MKGSFRALYRRSKFSGHFAAGESSNEEGQKRSVESRERFVGACFGFCIKHSRPFRESLLSLLLPDRPELVDQMEARIEDYDWADLLITFPTTVEVIVLELKIHAALADHQNPGKPAFMNYGYGQQIVQWATARATTPPAVRYFTLSNARQFSPQNEPPIAFESLTWKAFQAKLKPCPLIDDLRENLADLGVPCFRFEQTLNMNLATKATDAAKLLTLLGNVAEEMGLAGTMIDAFAGNDQESYVGRRIPIARNDKYASAVAARQLVREIGWFGYEGTEASVWFYCEPTAFDRIKRHLESSNLGRLQEKRDVSDIGLRKPLNDQLADQEWFVAVLRCAFAEAAQVG